MTDNGNGSGVRRGNDVEKCLLDTFGQHGPAFDPGRLIDRTEARFDFATHLPRLLAIVPIVEALYDLNRQTRRLREWRGGPHSSLQRTGDDPLQVVRL